MPPRRPAKVAVDDADQVTELPPLRRSDHFSRRSSTIPGVGDPLKDPVLSAYERQVAATCANTFGGTRRYAELGPLEQLRVRVGVRLTSRGVEYVIIGIVLAYSILVFFTLGFASDGCDATRAGFSESWAVIMSRIDIAVLSLFMLELLGKLFAFGPRYLCDAVSAFDAAIVSVSFAIAVYELVSIGVALTSQLVQVIRLGRIVLVMLIIVRLRASRIKVVAPALPPLERGVEAPVYRALSLLGELATRLPDEVDKRHLTWIAELIAANRLYEAVISETAVGGVSMDTETAAWLNSQYAIAKDDSRREPSKRRGSLSPNVQRQLGPAIAYGLRGLTGAQELELQEVLSAVDSWERFDVFKLNSASGGQPLIPLVMSLFHRHGFYERFNVRPDRLASALSTIQAGYGPVPYHNRVHAADVTQTLYCLAKSDAVAAHVTDVDLLAALLAAACHDFGHPGLNNPFHVKNRLKVALLYNDLSVLESWHASNAWAVLTAPDVDLLAGMARAEAAQVRETFIAMILGTDMSGHFNELAKFKTKTSSGGFESGAPENARMILKMALHCADVSNPAKAPDLCIPWSIRVMDEFFMQGDKEKQITSPVSPFMDRDNTVISKCQIGFINIIVAPLFEAWQAFEQSTQAQLAVDNCKLNADEWTSAGERRISDWLSQKGLTRDDSLLADHGPRIDAQCKLPPVARGEERFHYESIVLYRTASTQIAALTPSKTGQQPLPGSQPARRTMQVDRPDPLLVNPPRSTRKNRVSRMFTSFTGGFGALGQRSSRSQSPASSVSSIHSPSRGAHHAAGDGDEEAAGSRRLSAPRTSV